MTEEADGCFFAVVITASGEKFKIPSPGLKPTFRLPSGAKLLGILPFDAPELQPEGEHFDAAPQSVEGLTQPLHFVPPEASPQ